MPSWCPARVSTWKPQAFLIAQGRGVPGGPLGVLSGAGMQGRAGRFSESRAIPGYYRIAVAAGASGVLFGEEVPGHAAPFWEPGPFGITVAPGVWFRGRRAGPGGPFPWP